MKQFLNDVKVEFDKVTWPNKDELRDSTLVTIVVTTVFTLFIYFSDQIISFLIQYLYGLN